MANARKVAANVLCKIEKDGAYSNLTVLNAFRENPLTPEDKKLASAIIYGVLDRKLSLDYILSKFLKTPIKKTAPLTLAVLRSALYQIMFMDKIPESAAVNEAVKLIKKSKESRNSGFVNAVLRAVLREKLTLPQGENPKDLSIRYSCPLWIVESFLNDYSKENTIGLLEESLKTPPVTLRVNTTKITAEELIKKLSDSGIKSRKGDIENCVILENGTDFTNNNLFKEGLFHIQDTASQKAVDILNPKPFQRVLDMCAAPGGKSFTMAYLMENKGEIISCDLYDHKVQLIKDSAERLGLEIVKPTVADALIYNENLGKFDCILCDVVCSGLGVIRRKPEIKYKPQDNFQSLEKTQLSILENSAKYLKDKGKILYSTCTLRKAENEAIVNKFLQTHKDFKKEYEHTFMPHTDSTDGFFCALLVRG
ncbi:MAG: 16S rRNA (cytosine(967)-C(5))-methyltransferase RsmB [Clostridia bacterium]|nr:16S rRNA (cytosine(967)-C(5))-methyltransferase RsmB [Clostridia bacterium]